MAAEKQGKAPGTLRNHQIRCTAGARISLRLVARFALHRPLPSVCHVRSINDLYQKEKRGGGEGGGERRRRKNGGKYGGGDAAQLKVGFQRRIEAGRVLTHDLDKIGPWHPFPDHDPSVARCGLLQQ
jgi:hypothetical protein